MYIIYKDVSFIKASNAKILAVAVALPSERMKSV
jgi:hypothetical protein